jgi:hypothetical protein
VAGKSFVAAVILGLVGCSQPEPTALLQEGWAPAGACTFVGNRADRHFCATTGVQLLANPSLYDGHLIRVRGYLAPSPDGKDALLYLTRESLEGAETFSALSIRGPSVAAIAAYAARVGADQPAHARIEGRFRLHGLAPDGTRAKQTGPAAMPLAS